MLIVLEVSPSAKATCPVKIAPPTKSLVLALPAPPEALIVQSAVIAPAVPAERVTVKVKVVVEPVSPSLWLTSSTLSVPAGAGSSLVIVPVPLALPSVAPPVAAERVTRNVSSSSNETSPWTRMVIVWLVSPSAKLTVPAVGWPGAKSTMSARFAPPGASSVQLAPDRAVRAAGAGDGEGEGGGAGIALGERPVADRQAAAGVVVGDRAGAVGIAERRAAEWARRG